MVDGTIGMLCPSPSWGGLEMNVERLSRWLDERGHRIVFLGDPDSILFQRLSTSRSISARPFTSTSKVGDIFSSLRLARIVRDEGIRFLISNLNRNFLLTTLTGRLMPRDCKLIYMQHMHVGGTKRDWLHTAMYRRLDTWVTPLAMFGDVLLQKTKLRPEQIAVIPFGIELNRFTSELPSKQDARKRLELPLDGTIAGVVGRLDPKKGQHILIEAAARVMKAGHDLHLLIVGDESMHESTGYGAHLKNLAAQLGIEPVTHFRPYSEDVATAFAAMDIFALTSQSETYGMVTIEAMASGLPVIATNEGGTPGIVTDDRTGLLVKSLDVGELASALTRLLEDSSLAGRLAAAARQEAAARYSHVHQCELWEELLERLTRPNQ